MNIVKTPLAKEHTQLEWRADEEKPTKTLHPTDLHSVHAEAVA